MATYRIVIDDWLPVSLNQLGAGIHWAIRARAKRHDAEMIAIQVRQVLVPVAAGKRHVAITLTQATGRGRDADNVPKSILDGLVKCAALKDDSPRWCECSVRLERGKRKRTEIVLIDLEEP